MVAAAQVAIGAEDEKRSEGRARGSREVGAGSVGDGAGKLPAWGVVFQAKSTDAAGLLGCSGRGNAFGEDADAVFQLERVAGGGVAAHDVVVQHSLKLPAFAAGQFGQVAGTVEALLFAGHGHKDERGREAEFAEGAGAFQGDGHARGVVVGARRGAAGVQNIGVARVVVAGDEHHAAGLDWISSAQDGVDVGDGGWLGNAVADGLDESVAVHFEAAATLF